MGPGCFHPRNEPDEVAIKDYSELQWGRDVSIPEMLQAVEVALQQIRLQWGRDVSIPEIGRRRTGRPLESSFNGAGMFPSQKSGLPSGQTIPCCCFNGAGMFPSQKCSQAPLSLRLDRSLQWGRDVSIPEIFPLFGQNGSPCRLQWGRDVSIPEITLARSPVRVPRRLQWGRDVSIPEMQ